MSQAVLQTITEPPRTGAYLRWMWQRHRLATALPIEELRTEHRLTMMGGLWHLANPLLSVGVFYFVFGVLLGASRGVESNFILWLSIGVFGYGLTTRTILGGTRSLDRNQGLMRSVRFPLALIPVSVVFTNLLTFVFELLILGAVAIATGESLSARWLVLPVLVLGHSCFNLGGAFIAARINDSFRDIQQILPVLFQLLRYVSAVMFPLDIWLGRSDTPTAVRAVIEANPLIPLLNSYRWVFMGTAVDIAHLVLSAGFALALLIVGFIAFRRGERRYGLR